MHNASFSSLTSESGGLYSGIPPESSFIISIRESDPIICAGMVQQIRKESSLYGLCWGLSLIEIGIVFYLRASLQARLCGLTVVNALFYEGPQHPWTPRRSSWTSEMPWMSGAWHFWGGAGSSSPWPCRTLKVHILHLWYIFCRWRHPNGVTTGVPGRHTSCVTGPDPFGNCMALPSACYAPVWDLTGRLHQSTGNFCITSVLCCCQIRCHPSKYFFCCCSDIL